MNIDGLHNPFGLRASDNKIVLIEDIDRMNNGLRCGCVCPSCKEPFEARMGDIRRHHFAHSGRGCDETNVYLTGLYMLLAEYLSDGNELYLPPLTAYYMIPKSFVLTMETVANYVSSQRSSFYRQYEQPLFEEQRLCFNEDVQIIKTSEGKPKALLAKSNDLVFAIVITPPNTVCKVQTSPSRYQEYSTLEINLSEAGRLFQTKKKEEVFSYLKSKKSIYRWVYNEKISLVYYQVIAESKQAYENYKKESEEKQRILREMKEREEKREREREAERKRFQEEREKKRIQEEREREQARQEQERKREEKSRKIREAVNSLLRQLDLYKDDDSVDAFCKNNKSFLESWIEKKESDVLLVRKYKTQTEKSGNSASYNSPEKKEQHIPFIKKISQDSSGSKDNHNGRLYYGIDINNHGKETAETIEQIIATPPNKNILGLGVYSRNDFEKDIKEIEGYKRSGIRKLFTKLCYVSDEEMNIILDIYQEKTITNPETAQVIRFLLEEAEAYRKM